MFAGGALAGSLSVAVGCCGAHRSAVRANLIQYEESVSPCNERKGQFSRSKILLELRME